MYVLKEAVCMCLFLSYSSLYYHLGQNKSATFIWQSCITNKACEDTTGSLTIKWPKRQKLCITHFKDKIFASHILNSFTKKKVNHNIVACVNIEWSFILMVEGLIFNLTNLWDCTVQHKVLVTFCTEILIPYPVFHIYRKHFILTD